MMSMVEWKNYLFLFGVWRMLIEIHCEKLLKILWEIDTFTIMLKKSLNYEWDIYFI